MDKYKRKENKTPHIKQDEDVIVVGRKPALQLFASAPHRIKEVYLRKGMEQSKEFLDALEILPRTVLVTDIERDKLDELSDGENPQGVAVKILAAPPVKLSEIIESSRNGAGILVVIDQIEDPQNFGAVLRSVEALGADGVISTIRHTAPTTLATRRASMGASELLPMCRVNNLHQTIKVLRDSGFWIVGTTLDEGAKFLSESDFAFPLALIVGSESRGLRKLTLSDCDYSVKIPLRGSMQSLNVAQATSIVIYEIMRHRFS